MNSQPRKGHRERLHAPVDEQRDTDAAHVRLYLMQRAEVDLQQHRDDHHPHQHADRNVDPGNLQTGDGMEHAGQKLPEQYTGDDAQHDPDGQVTLEQIHLINP